MESYEKRIYYFFVEFRPNNCVNDILSLENGHVMHGYSVLDVQTQTAKCSAGKTKFLGSMDPVKEPILLNLWLQISKWNALGEQPVNFLSMLLKITFEDFLITCLKVLGGANKMQTRQIFSEKKLETSPIIIFG